MKTWKLPMQPGADRCGVPMTGGGLFKATRGWKRKPALRDLDEQELHMYFQEGRRDRRTGVQALSRL